MKKNLSILLSTVCLLGLTNVGKAQTNWNAYNDFYFDSTNYANHSPDASIPFPTSPSDTGLAWGYYDANINGYGGYPTNIGTYLGPGGNTSVGQVLQALAIYQPLGPGQGQIGGGVGASADAWDATGGSGWARYADDNGWGTSIGEYGGAWYAGAPGYGTPYASDPGLYLQPGYLGVPFSDGIANVVTWTAPSDGTYTFTGSFLIANSGGNAYAIVDSAGGVEVARTVGAPGTYNTFSFQKTLKAREIVEFQAGTDGQGAAPVGFNCNIQLVSITDWNAFNDFYFDSTNFITNSPGSFIPFPRSALGSVTSRTWGYYDANCNWYNGYPAAIGTYFGPGNNTADGQVLLALANYQPLGVGQGQVGGGVGTTGDAWDSTPGDGNGFARYGDDNGWGTSLGEYGGAWFGAAPGYGTPYAANDGLWMQAGWLGGNNTEGEGICPVVTWTAPGNGTYIFNGSFLIGNNGTSGPDGANCDYAIVDSLGGIETPRTVVAQGSYNTFSFQKTFSAGDVVEFQVGSDYQIGAAVGFNCVISDTPVPAVLISASRSLTNATQVSVQFNAPLYAPSADNAANFSINGVTVTSAELSPSDPTTVILSVSPGIYSAATLTVNGVENNFGQLPVAPNSTALITVPVSLPSGSGTPQEMAEKSQWVQQNLLTASNLPPFSFTYSGQASSVVLPSWTRTETDTVLDTNRTQHVITWTNNTLQVKCVAVEYNDYPLVQWTVYLQNVGTSATPILQSIQGLNTTMTRTNGPEFVLNGNQGDSASINSYEPYQTTLSPSTVNSFSPPSYSGKSCDTTGWPYYNVQTPDGGMILAIGWPGQWASSFTRDAGNDLQIQAGQQTTHLILNPGEQIRTPLIALMFWQGTNVVRSQNIWRHWYMAHVIPRVNGQPPATISQIQGDSTSLVQSYVAAGIQPNILWRDAGAGGTTWYPSSNGPYMGANQWLNTGTWVVDTNVYPFGFSRTSGQINAMGVKFLLWFEPERIGNTINSFLATNNPAWILPATSSTVGDILNEGNPGAFNWLTNYITGLITANGINWYREDMNGDGPLTAWQNNDAANRQGITENFYVQGHLAYWDALLALNPGLRIDCCGSGGRRNDLEAMSRAVPLDRSDYNGVTTLASADGEQCQTYGLSSWLPFQGTGCGLFDPYSFRSSYMASFGLNYLSSEVSANQQAYSECKKIAPIMLNGDYYPLTPYSQSDTVWMAWQFDWSSAGEGCVQIFRRTNSAVASMTFQLQGLNPAQTYDVSNFDTGDLGHYTGAQLMSTGIVENLGPRQSAILYYTTVIVPQINFGIQSGQMTLTWTNAPATLQSAGAITGPWANVVGATSPYSVTNSGGQGFYRLEQ